MLMYRIAGVGQMRLRQENKKGEIMDIRENLNVINGQLNQHITGNTNMNIIGGWRSVTNDGQEQSPAMAGTVKTIALRLRSLGASMLATFTLRGG
jgi:hypothetical protein